MLIGHGSEATSLTLQYIFIKAATREFVFKYYIAKQPYYQMNTLRYDTLQEDTWLKGA